MRALSLGVFKARLVKALEKKYSHPTGDCAWSRRLGYSPLGSLSPELPCNSTDPSHVEGVPCTQAQSIN